MSKQSPSELFATLKGYINQLSEGERTPSEVGAAFSDWAKESAESIKVRIHEEVESSVAKMGFIKREEFDLLSAKVVELEKALAKSKKSASKVSSVKAALAKSAKKKEAK